MSFRKLFHGDNHFGGKGRALARRRSRGLMHDVLPAMVETLEERALLSAVIPGFTDHGLVIGNEVAGQAEISITAANNAQLSNNATGSGLYINLDGSQPGVDLTALQRIEITGATIENNGNAGAQIILANMSFDTLIVDSSIFANNGTNGDGSGLYISLTNVSVRNLIITDSANVSDQTTANSGASSFNGNQFDGVTVVGAGATVDSLVVSGNVLDGNGQNGATLDFHELIVPDPANPTVLVTTLSTVANFTLDDNEATANGTGPAGGSGIHIATNRANMGVDIGAIINTGEIVNNTFDGNSLHGLSVAAESVDANSDRIGLAQIEIDAFNDNVTQNNGGAGVNFDLGQQTTLDATLLRNDFINNAGRGFNISATGALDPGLNGVIDPATDVALNAFDIQFGTLTRNALGVYVDANLFDGNTGAGIAIDLRDLSGALGNTKGTFRAYGNDILNSVAQTGFPLYTGDGINVRIRGDVQFPDGAAQIVDAIIDGNTIDGNAGDGIRFNVTEDSELTNLTIGNDSGENQAFDINGLNAGGENVGTVAGDGNTISDNGGDGIAIVRTGSAYVRDIDILDNSITGNANGIYIQASNTYQTIADAARPNQFVVTEVVINRNTIQGNNQSGVHFRTEFNAVLKADMRYNRIDDNTLHGIHSTAVENNFDDFENLGGTWIKNAITNNGQHGIAIEAVTGTVNPLIIGQDGFDVIDEQTLGNFIGGNGEDGIDIENKAGAAGTNVPTAFVNDVDIINNQIIGNGQNALDGSPDPYTAGKGIDIELHGDTRFGEYGAPRRFSIHRNIIEGNVGDGIEIRNTTAILGVIARGNTIQGNGGRGVDLLVTGSGPISVLAHVVFGGPGIDDPATEDINEDASNLITNNGLEGFYVVTTAASAQRQDVNAEDPLVIDTANAATESIVDLVLDVYGNEIRDNGGGVGDLGTDGSTFAGTGLVVRVGSNNSGEGHSTTPDLTGEADSTTDEAAAGVGTNHAGIGNGRTNVRVALTDFSGNAGDDVTFETFVSCVPPQVSGTWSAEDFKDFQPGYERDPLARLNVVFVGNTGESMDVVRGPASTDDTSTFFYTNDDGNWKRRTIKTGDNPDGPFNSGSWPRLVNRVADRPVASGEGALADAYANALLNAYFTGVFGGGSGNPFSGPNVPSITSFGSTIFGFATAFEAAPVGGGFPGDPPIRVTASGIETAPADPDSDPGSVGSRFRVTISDTGTANDGSYTATLISYDEDNNVAVFDLYNSTSFGNYNNNDEYVGGGDPVILSGVFDGSGNVEISQTITGIAQAPNTGNVDPLTEAIPTRVTAVLQSNPGTNFLVTISGSGTSADGTHLAHMIEYDSATGQATFDLYVPTDVGFYQTVGGVETYDGGGSPVPFSGTLDLTNISLVVHNPNKFYYDGLGPSTMRIESGWSDFDGLGDFSVTRPVANSPTSIGWDQVVSGTFSFLTVAISDDIIVSESAGTATFEVTLSEPAPEGGMFVSYQTSDGDAKDGITDAPGTNSDYLDASGFVFFAEGETTKTITINLVGDAEVEGSESFYVNLTDMSAFGEIVDRRGVITLTEPPVVSISDGEIVEGDDGTQMMEFVISLDGGQADPVTVTFNTTDGTATAGTDFEAPVSPTNQVVFQEGETTKSIFIPINGDVEQEVDATFTVTITSPDATIGDGSGTGEIFDNDTPTIFIDDVVVTETDGVQTATFTVTLSKAISNTVTVNFATSDQSATAGAAADYLANSGVVTFLGAPGGGETSKTISITINGDQVLEDTETFLVTLSGASSNAVIDTKNFGVGSIVDDDTPTITIDNVTIVEGDGGGVATFTVTLSQSANVPVSVDYATVDGTAEAGEDFAFTSGTLVFQAGVTSMTVSVPIIGDLDIEGNEEFNLQLSNPVKGKFGDNSGTATLINDDVPGLSVDDDVVIEGGFAIFTVRLSKPVNNAIVTVDFTTRNGTAFGSTPDTETGEFFGDFALQTGTLEFLQGEMVKTIVIETGQFDSSFEGTEYFYLDLVDPVNSTITDGEGQGAIVDPSNGIGLVVSPKAGYPPVVRVYDPTGQFVRYSFFAYQPSYRGGVKVATGDVNGDGVLDIITAPGSAGVGADIRAYDGRNGALIRRFFAFAPSFRGGFNVASGDVDGNGIDDIIVSVDAGWKSAVIAFDGQTTQRIGGFFAYGAYRGGVEIATGDIDGDGIAEILTVPGGTRVLAHVRAFRANGQIVSQFVAFPSQFSRGTFNIASGDVTGDGIDDVIVSVGSVMPPWIRVFNGATPQLLTSILAYPSRFRGGVSIGTGDVNLDGRADILTSTASGALPFLGAFDGLTGQHLVSPPNPFGNFRGGAYVSGNLYDTNFLTLDGEVIVNSTAASLEATQVEGLLAAAAGKFRAAGFSQAVADQIASSDIRVADLAGGRLAMARPGAIVLDVNAAGWGWFIDETPTLDEEFTRNDNGAYRAVAGSAAQGKVDLLSVLTHEIAHELGFDDLEPTTDGNSLLTATLPPGARRATREHFDDLFADADLMDELLTV